MSRRADPQAALGRFLARRTPGLSVVEQTVTPWASVTFTGARHRIVVAVPDAARAGFGDGIGCAEVPIPGHIVADIVVAAEGEHFVVEALTVEVD